MDTWPFDRPKWRVSPSGLETGDVVVGNSGTISFEELATLLTENTGALKSVLEKVATNAAKQVGNNHPLVIALETLVGTQFPPPIPPEGPTGPTKQPRPSGPGEGY